MRAAAKFLLGGVAYWCAPAPGAVVPPLARLFGVPTRLPALRGIALTFDDGPHPEATPAVLEILERAGARATFFLVTEQVERWPDVAAAIAVAGHEIGCHGHRHLSQLRRTPASLAGDLRYSADVLADVTGRSPRLYRPPYGIFSTGGLELVRRSGFLPMLWSRWGRDWSARATPASIIRTAATSLRPSDVVLLHDSDAYSSQASWRRTVSALPAIVEAAVETGEPLVCVSQST